MEKKEILSLEEAQELFKRLERFYKEPVLPLHNFCRAIRALDGLHRKEQYRYDA